MDHVTFIDICNIVDLLARNKFLHMQFLRLLLVDYEYHPGQMLS